MRYAILHASIVGPLWMPDAIASRRTTARIERSAEDIYPTGGPYPDLRTAMLALLNAGDFQACGFVPEETFLEVVEEDVTGPTSRRKTRTRAIAFGCWATDDLRAKEEWLADFYEYSLDLSPEDR